MTTIYELMEKATPTPLRIENATYNPDRCRVDGERRSSAEQKCVCTCVGYSPETIAEGAANADMIVHCVNNFIEILEALKVMVRCGEKRFPHSIRVLRNAQEVIAKMENVEEV